MLDKRVNEMGYERDLNGDMISHILVTCQEGGPKMRQHNSQVRKVIVYSTHPIDD